MSFRGRWLRNRARVIALLAAALLGLLGLRIASAASALPSPIQHVVVLYLGCTAQRRWMATAAREASAARAPESMDGSPARGHSMPPQP